MSIKNFTGSNFVGGDWQNGFGIQFTQQADNSVQAAYTFDMLKQGPPNIVHGGALSAVIDEAMTATIFAHQAPAFTANLNINFKAAVHIGTPISIIAKVNKQEGRKLFLSASITLPDEKVAVEATALFIIMPGIDVNIEGTTSD